MEEAQRWLATEEGKRRLSQRKVYVETVFAIAKDRHGLRRAQWRGKWKVQIQVWLTAAAMNIKKLARTTAAAGGASVGSIQAFSLRFLWGLTTRLHCTFGVLLALRIALGQQAPPLSDDLRSDLSLIRLCLSAGCRRNKLDLRADDPNVSHANRGASRLCSFVQEQPIS